MKFITQRGLLGFSALALIAAAATSCGQTAARVEGRLATSQFNLVGAQVVAIDAQGGTHRASIAADGSFSLELPVPATYNIRFANSTSRAGRYDAFAVLTEMNANGRLAERFSLRTAATIDLGLVQRPAASSVQGLSDDDEADDDDGAESEDEADDDGADDDGADDADSEDEDEADDEDSEGGDVGRDDVELVCDMSGGADYANVESENDLDEYVDSDGDGTVDGEDTESQCDDGDSDSDSDGTDTSTSADDDGDDDGDSDSDSDGRACSDDGLEDQLDAPCGGTTPPAETDPAAPPPGDVVPGNGF